MQLLSAIALLAAITGSNDSASLAHETVYLANLERAKLNLPPLKISEPEAAAARWLAEDLAARDDHTHIDSLGRDFRARAEQFKIAHPTGENCAAGPTDPRGVVQSWMESPGHRKNLTHPKASVAGVGYAMGDRGLQHYWAMVIGVSEKPPVIIDNEASTTDRDEVELFVYGRGRAEMIRLRNGDGPWSEWRAFEERLKWTLAPGKGTKVVQVEMRDSALKTWTSEDTIDRR